MIIDRVENWRRSFPSEETACVAGFLSGLTTDVADGEYPLGENGIFARVMTYETRPPEEARLEAHREYVDVQTAISGTEGIEWFPVSDLAEQAPYDPGGDVAFYRRPGPAPARVDVVPGTFVVFFPRDAHMPQLAVAGVRRMVKKAVVKIPARLGQPGG
ncbi:MAG: YhcH/YjgK/YiaL family protein [Deferrisomatales bacterium]|nr:YhcH/YjgK/YiaL family protein [Deferrisomatales bacterium]